MSEIRSHTESRKAPRTPTVPAALATGPSSRSPRPVSTMNVNASPNRSITTVAAVAAEAATPNSVT